MTIFLDAYAYMRNRDNDRAKSIASMAKKVCYTIEDGKAEHDLDELWKAVITQYPLIELLDNHKMRGGYYSKDVEADKNFDALMDYITAIDLVVANTVDEAA